MKDLFVVVFVSTMLLATVWAQGEDDYGDYNLESDDFNEDGPASRLDLVRGEDEEANAPALKEDEDFGFLDICRRCSCTRDLVCRFRCPLQCAGFGRGFVGQYCTVCSCLETECNIRCLQCSGIGPTLFTGDEDDQDK